METLTAKQVQATLISIDSGLQDASTAGPSYNIYKSGAAQLDALMQAGFRCSEAPDAEELISVERFVKRVLKMPLRRWVNCCRGLLMVIATCSEGTVQRRLLVMVSAK